MTAARITSSRHDQAAAFRTNGSTDASAAERAAPELVDPAFNDPESTDEPLGMSVL
jgi:hypothetical protein